MTTTITQRWVVWLHVSGSVRVTAVLSGELPAFIELHGCNIVKVCESMAEAISARHDEQEKCARHSNGRGKFVCDKCQEATLTAALHASVARNTARPRLRGLMKSDAARDSAGGSMALMAQKAMGRAR